MALNIVTASDIEGAIKRLAVYLRRTPILTLDGAEFGCAGRVTLKLEYLQQSGTFKARGATNFMARRAEELGAGAGGATIGPAGVTAASGGNHGAAVAWAAQQFGHKAKIFVPTISSPAKVERLRFYGADVEQVGRVYAESLEACEQYQRQSGATSIHAYEDPDVFAGAGTAGSEFQTQVEAEHLPPLDAVLVACGGGGLVGGVATWFGRDAAVVACETHDTAAFNRAKKEGEPVDVEVKGVAADALGASRIGSRAFQALMEVEAESVLVTDEQVIAAQSLLWQQFRIVVEPSAAVPVAALISGTWQPAAAQHTGVIVCGANTPLSTIS